MKIVKGKIGLAYTSGDIPYGSAVNPESAASHVHSDNFGVFSYHVSLAQFLGLNSS